MPFFYNITSYIDQQYRIANENIYSKVLKKKEKIEFPDFMCCTTSAARREFRFFNQRIIHVTLSRTSYYKPSHE